MAKDDQPNGFIHLKRSPERTTEFWRERLDDLERHHNRRRRAFDEAVADYQIVATALAEAQAEERKHPHGADPQAEFGAELEQARIKAERARLEFHNGRVNDLGRLASEVGAARDALIRDALAVDQLQRAIGTAAETIRQALWYAAFERDQAANYLQVTEAAKELQLRAAELPPEGQRRRGYGSGLL
jgi:DNA repair ATPase RecN